MLRDTLVYKSNLLKDKAPCNSQLKHLSNSSGIRVIEIVLIHESHVCELWIGTNVYILAVFRDT